MSPWTHTPVPYQNLEYYTIPQIGELAEKHTGLRWSNHNVSQRAPKCKFERVTTGVYTKQSVDRYFTARRLTAQARQNGYTSPALLWPDEGGRVEWGGKIYE